MSNKPDTSKALVLASDFGSITIQPDFIAYRDTQLATAREIRVVFDDAGQQAALAAIEELKALRIGVEKTREAVKRPIIDAGNRVEATAKQAVAGIAQEESRLRGVIEAHQRKLREAAAAEERRVAEEQRRIAQEAEDKRREVERREREAEAAKKRADEATGRQKKAAEKAAQEAEEALSAANMDAEFAAFESQQAVEVAPAAPVGVIVGKEVWDFEVQDLMLFASKFPDLCKIEIAKQKVNEAITAGTFDVPINPETTQIVGSAWADCKLGENAYRMAPGLRIFKRIKI